MGYNHYVNTSRLDISKAVWILREQSRNLLDRAKCTHAHYACYRAHAGYFIITARGGCQRGNVGRSVMSVEGKDDRALFCVSRLFRSSNSSIFSLSRANSVTVES